MESKSREKRGITLIALVITIIILLILSAITISMLTGENGLFARAKQAAEESTKAQLKEELELAILDIKTEKIAQGKDIVREDLFELSKIGATIENTEIPTEGEYKNYYFEIDENYVVTIIGKNKVKSPIMNAEIITIGSVPIGEKIEIRVTASIDEGTIEELVATNGAVLKTEISNTEKIFTVTENGKYYFEARANNGNSATIEVVVDTFSQVVTAINLNKNSTEILLRETETLIATVLPENAEDKSITWNSSDISVATVSEEGVVTALKEGTAIITATANDGSGQSASCEVKVIFGAQYYSVITQDRIVYAGNLKSDALGFNAYDGNLNTYITMAKETNKYINVDDSAYNKNMVLNVSVDSTCDIAIYFYNSSNTIIKKHLFYTSGKGTSGWDTTEKELINNSQIVSCTIQIPEGTDKIGFQKWNTGRRFTFI